MTMVLVQGAARTARRPASLDALAQEAGVEPGLARGLVSFGLVREPFPPDAAAQMARAMRLRRDLGLNLAGAVLACELLARIDELETRLARYESPGDRSR
jgi:hypothetical protein